MRVRFCIFFALVFLTACQEGKPLLYEISVGADSMLLQDNIDTAFVYLSSNYRWTITDVPGWLKVFPSSGTAGEYSINITAGQNELSESRQANLKFSAGSSSITVNISQIPAGSVYASGKYFFLSVSEISAPALGLDTTFYIRSNTEYTCSCESPSGSEWVSVKIASGIAYLSISRNNSGFNREGDLVIQSSVTPELKIRLHIFQIPYDTLIATPQLFNLSGEEGIISIKVSVNYDGITEYSVSCPDTDVWIEHETGANTKTFKDSLWSFRVERNPFSRERTGYIDFFGPSGTCLQRVAIVQQGFEDRIIEFEDVNFKTYLLQHFDFNKDKEISLSEAEKITSIYVSRLKIYSLKGIEYFPNLQSLICESNYISSLDLRGNKLLVQIYAGFNVLSEINLSKCTKLITLEVSCNNLELLDVSHSPELESVFLSECMPISMLDLRTCKKIRELICLGCYALKDLYLDHIPAQFSYSEWGSPVYLDGDTCYFFPAIWVNGQLMSTLY